MNKTVAFLRTVFLGFILGFIVSVLLGRSVWLEMRLNLAIIIPVSTVVGLLSVVFFLPPRKLWWILVPEMILLLVMGLSYRSKSGAWAVLPAIMLREGLGMDTLRLNYANLVLVLILLGGNLVWLISFRRDCLGENQ